MPNDEFEITRRIEFDAGHRIPYHKHKCYRLHGHRYVLEATLRGVLHDTDGASSFGMVEDFGDIKEIMTRRIANHWDHRMLLWRDDLMANPLQIIPDAGVVLLTVVPTSENLARLAFNMLAEEMPLLARVRLYETPNCWSDVERHSGV